MSSRWYESLLPFIARSPQAQVRWLAQALVRGRLADQEVTPYIRLLLLHADTRRQLLEELLASLDRELLTRLLRAADVRDTALLLRLIPPPDLEQAVLALAKEPAAYEADRQGLFHAVCRAVDERDPALREQAAAVILDRGVAGSWFAAAYDEYLEVLADEAVLRMMFPKAARAQAAGL
ncbi:MAG: hypothetical protein AB1634_00750 [Thermodesulfobacteriota bacterium]